MAIRLLHAGALALCMACLACGEPGGPYETAGVEWRSSGGDEVISDRGEGVGTDEGPGLAAPVETLGELRQALDRAKARRENELRHVDSQERSHLRLSREIQEIDEKIRNVDLAFLRHREGYSLAERAANTFVFQFATEREWEMTYAMRAGDIGLASSIVQGVLADVSRTQPTVVEHLGIPDDAPELTMEARTAMRDLNADLARAEGLGADALLKLAQLAVEAADFGEAERLFRACLNYESDLAIRADALNGYAALLEFLDRDEEAHRIDSITSRALQSQR